MGYIIIDCEWNYPESKRLIKVSKKGVPLNSELMQIGAVKLNNDFEKEWEYSCDIKPIRYKIIHPDVLKLTKVNHKKLSQADYFPNVWKDFSSRIEPDDIFIEWGTCDEMVIKNNIEHWDVGMLNNQFIDLQMEITKNVYKDHTNRSLERVLEDLKIKQELDFHTAINDAIYTARIFKYIRTTDISEINIEVDEEAQNITAETDVSEYDMEEFDIGD